MNPYIVKQGDYLDKIAHALRFDADKVWNDPANAELKKQRDPDVLLPGDILQVPEVEPQWLPFQSGVTNRYVATIPKASVRLTFKNDKGPLANEPYAVLGLASTQEGTTDGDGGLVLTIPVVVRECQVAFPQQGIVHAVRVGDMDPIDDPSGVRKRLQHLGYGRPPGDAAPSEDEVEAADQVAILAFQKDSALPLTGVVDDATKAALIKAHGT
jgi:hypothetical protein